MWYNEDGEYDTSIENLTDKRFLRWICRMTQALIAVVIDLIVAAFLLGI